MLQRVPGDSVWSGFAYVYDVQPPIVDYFGICLVCILYVFGFPKTVLWRLIVLF